MVRVFAQWDPPSMWEGWGSEANRKEEASWMLLLMSLLPADTTWPVPYTAADNLHAMKVYTFSQTATTRGSESGLFSLPPKESKGRRDLLHDVNIKKSRTPQQEHRESAAEEGPLLGVWRYAHAADAQRQGPSWGTGSTRRAEKSIFFSALGSLKSLKFSFSNLDLVDLKRDKDD